MLRSVMTPRCNRECASLPQVAQDFAVLLCKQIWMGGEIVRAGVRRLAWPSPDVQLKRVVSALILSLAALASGQLRHATVPTR